MNVTSYQPKKKTHTHTHKYMKFYNFLLWVFIFWDQYMIVHYQLSLSIVNVARCDYFILLNFVKIYIFMQLLLSICHYFYKNILNKMTKCNSHYIIYWLTQPHSSIHKYYIKCLLNQSNALTLPTLLLPSSHFVCPVWKVKLFKRTLFIVLFTF